MMCQAGGAAVARITSRSLHPPTRRGSVPPMNGHHPTHERITTQEAARRLGVSPTQVRRLAATGKLRSEREERPQGTRLVILWDETPDAPETPPDAPRVATEDATPATDTRELVQWLRERLEKAEEERSELRRMLFLEQQTVANLRAQLPPPRDMDAPTTEQGTPPTTPPAVASRPPWWQWWKR
jgi:excisionase family DNA binding protein